MKEITVKTVDHQRVGNVLQQIADRGKFTFAYNNRAVPADSLISVADFHGTIYTFLNNTLGGDYEFKEVPGYIVLRHAPNKMDLNATIEEEKGQQVLVKGQVVNATNQQQLNQVSVYEKNQLISTLTNEKGEFELRLTNGNGPILLTAIKENYRDTSLYLLRDVNISLKKSRRYKYYPDEAADRFGKGFSRLFISSKQRIQNLNLGGFFAYSPYQASLTPGLSTHGMYNSQVIDHFSLNIFGGYTAGIQGVELAGMFNINRKDVAFLQVAGMFNIVGGSINGIELAGLYNHVLTETNGVQITGGINRTTHVANGVQLAGIANSANEVKGMQLAGLFNVAKKVRGVQFAGLFNVADSSDYPVALVNFIKNGKKSLALSYDESQYTHIDFRSGGRVLYGLIGAGYKFNDASRYAFDIGFGAHIINQSRFSLDAEYGYEVIADFKKDPDQISSFKLLPGLKLSHTLQLFAGPTIALASYNAGDGLNLHGWSIHEFTNGDNINKIYAGVTGGLQVTW